MQKIHVAITRLMAKSSTNKPFWAAERWRALIDLKFTLDRELAHQDP